MKENLNLKQLLRSLVLVATLTVTLVFSQSSLANSQQCLNLFLSQLEQAKSKEGYFTTASSAIAKTITDIYNKARLSKEGLAQPPKGQVKRVDKEDISVKVDEMNEKEIQDLRKLSHKAANKMYIVTSGAGLWSRGAGQIKALLPYNLKETLGNEKLNRIEKLSQIATASSPEEVLKKTNYQFSSMETRTAKEISLELITQAKAEINQLIKEARSHKNALTPLDMKLVNVALLSQNAHTYVPFDIWTSHQTHAEIADYLKDFNLNFKSKSFHPDPNINAKIHIALARYIKESEKRNETHLFGVQIGVHALNPKTGEAITESVAIGEGAGMLKTYLDQSGRTAELLKQGKVNLLFDNIEVITDLEVMIAAHELAGTPTSVVVVEERKGYSGGSPFAVQRSDGAWSIELHEQSALPSEFAKGNKYFNTNTLIYSLVTKPFYTLGFEEKKDRGQTIIRVKLNAGDVTKETKTAAISGRIGIDYENFKNYTEYGLNGGSLIQNYQKIWSENVSNP